MEGVGTVISFIPLSIGRHLGYFHSLATVNNTTMKEQYRNLLNIIILFSLNIYLEVGLLGYMVVLCLISWGNSILFSTGCTRLHFSQQCPRVPSSVNTVFSQYCFYYLGSVMVSYTFQILFSVSVKSATGILIEIMSNQ